MSEMSLTFQYPNTETFNAVINKRQVLSEQLFEMALCTNTGIESLSPLVSCAG